MPLTAGTKLGPYEVQAPLGAGGMGEVYKARDTRLERTVAIKVLPPHLSANPELRQRFEREARTISSLNHPHICTLYDIGQQDGVDFLVMEYLEGETLAQRLQNGPLPTDQVLRCAIEISDALHKAHRQGVTHRDLKPANVMLTKAGAKLLDFGLAKYRPAEPVLDTAATVSDVPTQDAKLTTAGTVLGTFQYMAPEQLEGKEADARTDIFALGAMLYEMATGRPAFAGRSRASLIAAILEHEPPSISTLQPMTPPALDHVIRRCLGKEPEERWQTAHDVKMQLQWIAEGGSKAGVPAPVVAQRRRKERLWIAATALLSVVAVAALLGLARGVFRAKPLEVGAVRFLMAPPEGVAIAPGPAAPQVAVSPDGRKLALAAVDSAGKSSLWVRALGSLSPQRLEKTEGAAFPFWSPDSEFIAFFADGKVKKIAVAGGSPQTLCDAKSGEGGTWSGSGVIVFAATPDGPLYRVAAAGGLASPVTALDKAQGQISHRWPQFFPDDRHFLYLALSGNPEKNAIYIQSLGSPQPKRALNTELRAAFAPPGFLLFIRDGMLMAQELDSKRFELRGEPVAVAEEVNSFRGRGAFSISQNGVLAYRAGWSGSNTQLAWYNRDGKRLSTVGEPGQYSQITLSPDEKRVAVVRAEARGALPDIWMLELSSGIFSRLTFDPAYDTDPVWSPDSRRIAFVSPRSGKPQLLEVTVGSGVEKVLYSDEKNKYPDDWSRDGRSLIYHDTKTAFLLPILAEPKPEVVLQSPFDKDEFHFSPDGRWLAYHSNESGRFEVYVASFPGFAEKRQISNGGGCQALWRKDGKELFYLTLDGKLMAVEIKAGRTLEAGVPKLLFPTGVRVFHGFDQYCVTGDGQRFLVNEVMQTTTEQLSLVINWNAHLRR